MTGPSTIIIGEYKIKSTKQSFRKLKAILDKLEVPHILDDISFNDTHLDPHRMKFSLHDGCVESRKEWKWQLKESI